MSYKQFTNFKYLGFFLQIFIYYFIFRRKIMHKTCNLNKQSYTLSQLFTQKIFIVLKINLAAFRAI
jgi:hypothetical protein